MDYDLIDDLEDFDLDEDMSYDEFEEEDLRSLGEKELADRLDMGRNDAGEWIGFC